MKTNLKIVEASAGTGKTFLLSSEVIKILAKFDQDITALTFTKKATAEIEQRVLLRLCNAVLSKEAAQDLISELEIEKSDFDLILQSILNNNFFTVNTIDGFFNKIAKNFSDQLQLPSNWKLVEQNQIQEFYINAIISLFDSEDLESINQLIQLLDQSSAQKSIFYKVLYLVNKLIDIYILTKESDWSIDYVKEFELNEEETLEKIRSLELPKNKDGSFDKIWTRNVKNSLDYFSKSQWIKYLDSGLIKAILEKKEKFSRKVIDDNFKTNFEILNSKALNEVLKQYSYKALSLRKIIETFWSHYQKDKYSNSIVTFNDILFSLANSEIKYQDILLSLDNRINHLLIDEFQDTSATQWEILKRHVEEIISADSKSCLLVGDIKQAIYGWRGGESRIFEHTKSSYKEIEIQNLDYSYRSSKKVIENINNLFSNIDQIDCLKDYKNPTSKWKDNFRTHKTNIKKEGLVQHYSDTDYDLVAEVIEKNKDSTIGILVQTNDKVEEVIENLSYYDISISQEGGSSLYNSPIVKIFVACLKVLDDPSNTNEFYIVSCTNLLKKWGINTKQSLTQQARDLSEFLHEIYFKHDFNFLTNFLIEELKKENFDLLKLQKIKDLAFSYKPKLLDEFCSLIKETKFSSTNEMRHKVMTIHQSKGLEFDIVILLELNTSIIDSKSSILNIYGDEFGEIEKTIPFPNKLIRTASPKIESYYKRHQNRQVEQHLCNLYVALSRAKNELHIFLNESNTFSLNKILKDFYEKHD